MKSINSVNFFHLRRSTNKGKTVHNWEKNIACCEWKCITVSSSWWYCFDCLVDHFPEWRTESDAYLTATNTMFLNQLATDIIKKHSSNEAMVTPASPLVLSPDNNNQSAVITFPETETDRTAMLQNATKASEDSSPSFSPHNDPIESPLQSPVDTNCTPTMLHLSPIVSGIAGDIELTAAAMFVRKRWWQRIEQMFYDGLMLKLKYNPYTKKTCKEGFWIQCKLWHMSEGASDRYFSLCQPFDQYYCNQHVLINAHMACVKLFE